MNADGIKTTFTLDDVILMTDWTNAYPWSVVLHCNNTQAQLLSKLTLNIKNILNLETFGMLVTTTASAGAGAHQAIAPPMGYSSMGYSSKRTTTKPLNSSKVSSFVSLCAKYMSFSSNHSNIYKMATLIMAHVLLDDIDALESKIALLKLEN